MLMNMHAAVNNVASLFEDNNSVMPITESEVNMCT